MQTQRQLKNLQNNALINKAAQSERPTSTILFLYFIVGITLIIILLNPLFEKFRHFLSGYRRQCNSIPFVASCHDQPRQLHHRPKDR